MKIMKMLFTFLTLLTSILCSSEPLSKLDEFNVYLNFSPESNLDQKVVKSTFKNSLIKVGRILQNKTSPNKSRPILFFHLDGITGSVKVISEVIVPENGFKTACSIWEYKYQPESVIPIETQKGITFEKKKNEFVSNSPDATIEHIVQQFASEYKKMNANAYRPTFYLQLQED